MPTVNDVSSFLEQEGLVGGSSGWDVVRRRLSDQPIPDQVVVVSEDGGPPPEIPADEGLGDSALADRGVLVTVRAAAWDSDASSEKASAILTALHGLRSTTVGSTLYYRVRALTSEPVFAGFDNAGRPVHTIAFRLLAAL